MSSRDDDAFSWAGDDDPTLRPVSERTGDAPEATDEIAVEELESRGAVETAAAPSDPVAVPVPSRQGKTGVGSRPQLTVLEEAEEAEELAAARDLADAERETAPLSSVALIVLGILGGIYALYTIGWLISFGRFPVGDGLTFTILTIRMLQVLAVAAAPLWFGGTLLILQKRPIRYRFLWLVIGVLVLVPWPFLMGV